jgi:hypothetical protein
MSDIRVDKISRMWLIFVFSLFIFSTFSQNLSAQEKPPKPVGLYLYNAKNLEFGAFAIRPGGVGGTVTVMHTGGRSSTGDIIELNLGHSFSPAYFEIEGNPGTLVQFSPTSGTATLTGGTGTLLLQYNLTTNSSVGNQFIINTNPPARMLFQVGGTLVVGNALANPPGNYSGTFAITVIQQ